MNASNPGSDVPRGNHDAPTGTTGRSDPSAATESPRAGVLPRVRILLVDDNPAFLEAVASWLSSLDEIDVVGYARSGDEALERVDELEPDLVLMDLSMPGMGGLETMRHLAARPRRPRVILMTVDDDEEYRAAAATAGVDGFLSKAELRATLPPLFRTPMAGCRQDRDATQGLPGPGTAPG